MNTGTEIHKTITDRIACSTHSSGGEFANVTAIAAAYTVHLAGGKEKDQNFE